MSEHHVDQEETVLAYVRLKSGARPYNLHGDGSSFGRPAPRGKAPKAAKPVYTDNVIDLAAERAMRTGRLK